MANCGMAGNLINPSQRLNIERFERRSIGIFVKTGETLNRWWGCVIGRLIGRGWSTEIVEIMTEGVVFTPSPHMVSMVRQAYYNPVLDESPVSVDICSPSIRRSFCCNRASMNGRRGATDFRGVETKRAVSKVNGNAKSTRQSLWNWPNFAVNSDVVSGAVKRIPHSTAHEWRKSEITQVSADEGFNRSERSF